MTTLSQLRTSVARDIRDPNKTTFVDANLTDLINAGISEVSRVCPRETIEDVNPVVGTYIYPVATKTAFRAEVWRDGAFYTLIAHNDEMDSSQGGWSLHGGNLIVPNGVIDSGRDFTLDVFKLFGYSGRAQLVNDNDVAELDADTEWGVRAYARFMAFQSMNALRPLFSQWQAQSQNTDVSLNQLEQMVTIYSREWDKTRNHLRTLRKV